MEIRRRLDEVLARYVLEPSLKDVYVEGHLDSSFLKWFFGKIGKSNVHIYEIQTVDIPESSFQNSVFRKDSNHDMIILLSEILANHFNRVELPVRCIADADYDRHLMRCKQNHILLYTDFTSMQMYLFNESCVLKTISFMVPAFPISAVVLLSQLINVLQELFLIRLTNEKLKWGMAKIDIKNYTRWLHSRILFDKTRYIQNYLTTNGKKSRESEFHRTMDTLKEGFESDPRHNIRGHDFTYLLFLTLKRESGHHFGVKYPEAFERIISGFSELDDVKDFNLFTALAGI